MALSTIQGANCWASFCVGYPCLATCMHTQTHTHTHTHTLRSLVENSGSRMPYLAICTHTHTHIHTHTHTQRPTHPPTHPPLTHPPPTHPPPPHTHTGLFPGIRGSLADSTLRTDKEPKGFPEPMFAFQRAKQVFNFMVISWVFYVFFARTQSPCFNSNGRCMFLSRARAHANRERARARARERERERERDFQRVKS
jgi:hypothetical protein